MAGEQKKCVFWLHTQPEHYFNLLIDELNLSSDLEYIAGYMLPGTGQYEQEVPRHSRHVFLRMRAGMENQEASRWRAMHVDWWADIDQFSPSCVVVSGYAGATQRGCIHEFHKRGVPVLMIGDNNIRVERGRGLKKRVKRCVKKRVLGSIIRKTDCLLTMNSRGVAYWRYFGAPREKIRVCPFYSDYAAIERARGTDRAALLKSFGLPQRKMILTAARLVPLKRIGPMIRFFRELELGAKGWMYVIAGEGPLEAELKEAAGKELGSSIHFVGFVQPGRLMGLMCHAQLFCLTSDYEGHGIVIGESCAAGTPVLTSDICGAGCDLIVEGISGWRFRNMDLADLRRKLEVATADVERLAAMRVGTRAAFESWMARTNPVVVVDWEVRRLLGLQVPQCTGAELRESERGLV